MKTKRNGGTASFTEVAAYWKQNKPAYPVTQEETSKWAATWTTKERKQNENF